MRIWRNFAALLPDQPNLPCRFWPCSTMDSIRVSEAPDPGSIPGEATSPTFVEQLNNWKFPSL